VTAMSCPVTYSITCLGCDETSEQSAVVFRSVLFFFWLVSPSVGVKQLVSYRVKFYDLERNRNCKENMNCIGNTVLPTNTGGYVFQLLVGFTDSHEIVCGYHVIGIVMQILCLSISVLQ
jgi:hypothetical protein